MSSPISREVPARHSAQAGHSPVAPEPSWNGQETRPTSGPDHDRIAELLSLASAGDADAFAAAYDTLAPHVWALTQAVVRDRDLAKAATQQAFEDMWQTAPNCPPSPGAATAWAMGIAVRRAARTAAETAERDDLPEGPGKPVAGIQPGAGERVRRALLTLPARQRDCVLLTCYGRLALGQVAQVLDAPQQEAAVLLRDGLERLRDLLAVGAHRD